MITLEIPRVPESPNNFLGFHWRHRQRNSKLWQQEIRLALIGIRPAQPFARARVSIERRSRGELDPDNLVGSVKPLVDALRYAGVLVDDTPKHLVLEVTQTRCPTKMTPCTRIEIHLLESV